MDEEEPPTKVEIDNPRFLLRSFLHEPILLEEGRDIPVVVLLTEENSNSPGVHAPHWHWAR